MHQQKGWMMKAVRYTQSFVGIEPQVRELILRELSVETSRVHYVANGIPDIWKPQPAAVEWGLPIPEKARVVGMIARMAENKDPHTLVDAMVEVHRRCPDVHLIFAGTGPLEEQVRQHIAQVGAEEYIHLLGLRRDVPDILHAIDIFVLSSHLEGQPLAVIEAMSAQRPIVATDVGGNSILLDGGRCGVLVPPRDPQAMAAAILQLLTDREKAQQLALNARQRFLEQFTVDAMGKRYLEVYQQAIEGFRSG
jgi:glycosyltransferase involved in cell wall biosynthesis